MDVVASPGARFPLDSSGEGQWPRAGGASPTPALRAARRRRWRLDAVGLENRGSRRNRASWKLPGAREVGV
jgi:hypothetical protein